MGVVQTATDLLYGRTRFPAWMWPVTMVLLGVGALIPALVFYPGGDEWTYIFGMRFGGGCAFLETTGQPCPSCGMTRSWVHLARGEFFTSAMYNIAGSTLLLWLVFTGILGSIRLATRNYTKWTVPYNWVAGWALFWMIALYMGLWITRMLGVNPLP